MTIVWCFLQKILQELTSIKVICLWFCWSKSLLKFYAKLQLWSDSFLQPTLGKVLSFIGESWEGYLKNQYYNPKETIICTMFVRRNNNIKYNNTLITRVLALVCIRSQQGPQKIICLFPIVNFNNFLTTLNLRHVAAVSFNLDFTRGSFSFSFFPPLNSALLAF